MQEEGINYYWLQEDLKQKFRFSHTENAVDSKFRHNRSPVKKFLIRPAETSKWKGNNSALMILP